MVSHSLVGPALGHLDGLGPTSKPLRRLLLGNLRLEDGTALGVDLLQVIKALPDTNGETRCNGRTQCCRLTHAGKLGQGMSAVLLHRVENGLCLETRRLERRPRNVPALRVRRDTKDGASRIVNPVRRKQAAKGRNKGAPTIVLHRLGQSAELGRRLDEAKVVHEELDTGARHRDAAFQGVHGVALAKVKGDRCQQAVRRNDWLCAHIV
ncbi:hypothetical protein HG531_008917 [Fusarium graminearum]|nr:hypothetical protein HG531_008917 [Fusarium graminearum]